jgi:hypothetical protein
MSEREESVANHAGRSRQAGKQAGPYVTVFAAEKQTARAAEQWIVDSHISSTLRKVRRFDKTDKLRCFEGDERQDDIFGSLDTNNFVFLIGLFTLKNSVFWKSALIMASRYRRKGAEVDRKKRRAADTTHFLFQCISSLE